MYILLGGLNIVGIIKGEAANSDKKLITKTSQYIYLCVNPHILVSFAIFFTKHPNNSTPLHLDPSSGCFFSPHTSHNVEFPSETDMSNLTQRELYLLWVLTVGSRGGLWELVEIYFFSSVQKSLCSAVPTGESCVYVCMRVPLCVLWYLHQCQCPPLT